MSISCTCKLIIIQTVCPENRSHHQITESGLKDLGPWRMCIDPKAGSAFTATKVFPVIYEDRPWKLARIFSSLFALWGPNSVSTFPYPGDNCEVLGKEYNKNNSSLISGKCQWPLPWCLSLSLSFWILISKQWNL